MSPVKPGEFFAAETYCHNPVRQAGSVTTTCLLSPGHAGPCDDGACTADPAQPVYYRVRVGSDLRMVECADVIDALGASYNIGCALKYLWRLDRKGDAADALNDLRKARAYIEREIARRGGK